MDCYIISYFGEHKLALQRQALHYQQLCCLLQQEHIENIYILSMNYQKHCEKNNSIKPAHSLYMSHPRIHYIDSELVPPSVARNRLIEVFNQSGKPWAMFADNDAYIDPRFQGNYCIPVIEHFADTVAEYADVLSTLNPGHTPFNEQLEKNKDSIETHLWLRKQNYLKTTLFFLRNRTYYNEKPVYFDETLSEMEDFEYQGRILAHGKGTYQLPGVLMLDLGWSEDYSTLFANKARTTDWDTIKTNIYKRYQPYGASLRNGSIHWSGMEKIKKPRSIWLPLNLTDSVDFNTVDRSNFHTLFDLV